MPSRNSQNIPPAQTKQQLSAQFASQNAHPKKDTRSDKPSSYELKQTVPPPDPSLVSVAQQKKPRPRSGKPIINWLQRKLAGTVRPRRSSEGENLRVPTQRHNSRRSTPQERPRKHPASPSLPKPLSSLGPAKSDAASKAISLNEDDEYSIVPDGSQDHSGGDEDDYSNPPSFARGSTWSPASILEADDNASLRPLPPSAPPSPSPSRSSSSYLSNPRTFRSMAASTKPTTVLSVDLTGGVAHIAQAPASPVSAGSWFSPHVRTSSTGTSTGLGGGGSITFSALPPSPQSSRPSSSLNNTSTTGNLRPVQAPQYTAHHPRTNPRPSSPPSDNASVLTLASSAFAFPGARIGVNSLSYGGERSFTAGADSISHISGSQFLGGEDDRMFNDGDIERDLDASVRALRPRSSRRGSWDSEGSGWSAGGTYSVPPGTPIGTRERSLWTTNSVRTGDNVDEDADDRTGVEEDEVEGSEFTQNVAVEKHAEDGDFQLILTVAPVEHSNSDVDASTECPETFPVHFEEKLKQEDNEQESVAKASYDEATERSNSGPSPLGVQSASDVSELDSFHTALSTPLPQ